MKRLIIILFPLITFISEAQQSVVWQMRNDSLFIVNGQSWNYVRSGVIFAYGHLLGTQVLRTRNDSLFIVNNNVWTYTPSGTMYAFTQVQGNQVIGMEGGTTGQYLKKNSNTNYDYVWYTAPAIPDSTTYQTKYRSDTARTNTYNAIGTKQPIGSYLVAADITGKLNTADTSNMLSAYRTAINGKQAAGTYATGTGTASGTNTGDNAVNSTYANDYRAANFVAGTNYVTPTGIGMPVYAQVTGSNVTTTGQALTDITGLSVALTTNAVYEFEAVLSVSTSAVTTGTAYGVNYSAAGGTVEAQITGASTSTASKTLRINALNSATALYLATSAQTGGVIIKGRITTGANAGNLTIQHLKLTSGTSTVFIGSFLKVVRIS